MHSKSSFEKLSGSKKHIHAWQELPRPECGMQYTIPHVSCGMNDISVNEKSTQSDSNESRP
jgi:hypothetical protein